MRGVGPNSESASARPSAMATGVRLLAVGDVADGVHAGHRGLQPGVDLHRADARPAPGPGRRCWAGGRWRSAPTETRRCVRRPAPAAGRCRCAACAAAPSPGAAATPAACSAAAHGGAQHLVEAAQRQAVAVVQRHLHAQPRQHAGELHRDVAAADDGRASPAALPGRAGRRWWRRLRCRECCRSPAPSRWRPGCGARSACGRPPTHRVRAGDARPAFDQRDAGAGQHLAVDAFQPVRLGGLRCLPACHVEAAARPRPSRSRGPRRSASPYWAAYISSFFGTQPRSTQVPPTRRPSTMATFAPCSAARREAATPPRAGAERDEIEVVGPCRSVACRTMPCMSPDTRPRCVPPNCARCCTTTPTATTCSTRRRCPTPSTTACSRNCRRWRPRTPSCCTPDSPTQRVIGRVLDGFAPVRHARADAAASAPRPTPRAAGAEAFDARVRRELALPDDAPPVAYAAELKFDGLAINLRYEARRAGAGRHARRRRDRRGRDAEHPHHRRRSRCGCRARRRRCWRCAARSTCAATTSSA